MAGVSLKMSKCKKRPQCTREFLKPPEKTYRDLLYNKLHLVLKHSPASDKSKVFVVSMVKHKLEEGLKK
jgi:hypothetical protein